MLLSGYVLSIKGHVAIDIFYGRLSARTRAILDLCTDDGIISDKIREGYSKKADNLIKQLNAFAKPVFKIDD